MVSKVLGIRMRGPNSAWLERFYSVFSICFLITTATHAQRLVLPPDSTTPSQSESQVSPLSAPESSGTHVLKTYPDGTKKIVPLEALNYRDDGAAFGGPPRLALYNEPTPTTIPSGKSPERLSVAPIGIEGQSADLNASVPASPDALAGSTQVAAVDPMGGGGGGADPMGGGGSSAPIDPLAGTPQKTAPPLQTVSGKPAPIVGDATTLQLGEWESFFLNAGIGGALQGQLTARRIWNGNNRQAYPYTYTSGPLTGVEVAGENFTFNPGFRLDVEFGYNFYEWLGVGLQTGLTYNGINQYNATFNTSPGGGLPAGSYNMSADGDLVQVPVQINGILRWPGQVKFRPFIGGGVGAIWQQLDVNNYYLANTDIQGNYCRSAFQFGWNAQLGATYTVEPGVDFYGAFKMLSAFMPVIGNYQFENSYNFAIEVGIQSRF
jgi:opacity protein-like surface antigen